MRVNAYVLAGDPAWIPHSIGSYYPLVNKIVVSYDAGHHSWSGKPLAVAESLARLRSSDPENKMIYRPGNHSDPTRLVLDVETEHRQSALDAASAGADWVLQFDTDEVALSRHAFGAALRAADDAGAQALEYPLRDFYAAIGHGRFLEHCNRLWADQAAYPGPVAVRAGTTLDHCRQARAPLYRVDMRSRNTDPWHPAGTRVDRVISRHEAIAHLSWVRTREQMNLKASTSGYAAARNWDVDLAEWERRSRHPWLTCALTPVRRNRWDALRIARLHVPAAAE